VLSENVKKLHKIYERYKSDDLNRDEIFMYLKTYDLLDENQNLIFSKYDFPLGFMPERYLQGAK
jgi:hypothetical protein